MTGDPGFEGRVQAYQGQGNPTLHHRTGGARIVADVGLGKGGAVAGHGQGAPHDGDAADPPDGVFVLCDGVCQIGERGGGDQRQIGAVAARGIEDEIHRGDSALLRFGPGQLHVADAVLAVDLEFVGRQRVAVGPPGAGRALKHRHFRVPQQLQQVQRVLHCDVDGDVAKTVRDPDQLHPGQAQGVSDGQRVVDAGVQVQYHLHLKVLLLLAFFPLHSIIKRRKGFR